MNKMKKTIVLLVVSMMVISTLYGLLMHILLMSFDGNLLLHSLIMGSLFGLLLSLIVIKFYGIYNKEKSRSKQLESTIRMDALTHLYNRKAFDKDTSQISSDSINSMLFIDIDNFRDYNNRHGHQMGDDVLRTCSSIIKESIRHTDSAYRYGGDEIAVLLKGCEKREAEAIAKRILERSNNDKDFALSISLSIGIASMPEDVQTIDQLINASDNAMLSAKQNGKNRIWFYKHSSIEN